MFGTGVGVWLFAIMRRAGQMDLVVSLSYVPLLGIIGGIMLNESIKTLRAAGAGQRPRPYLSRQSCLDSRPAASRLRFRQSRLYISVIPPLVIGFVVGTLSAIMGIGGGFIIVPAMIYLLRMPTNVVIGTSLVQIIGITAITTVLQATSNYAVDIVLAAILIAGRRGRRPVRRARRRQAARRADRLLLALLVLAVCATAALGPGGAAVRFLQPALGS